MELKLLTGEREDALAAAFAASDPRSTSPSTPPQEATARELVARLGGDPAASLFSEAAQHTPVGLRPGAHLGSPSLTRCEFPHDPQDRRL
jgi:hypothetical protein